LLRAVTIVPGVGCSGIANIEFRLSSGILNDTRTDFALVTSVFKVYERKAGKVVRRSTGIA